MVDFGFGVGQAPADFCSNPAYDIAFPVKSAIFFTVGHAAQAMGTQNMAEIRGLIRHHPGICWGLLIGVAAIAGFPPFGVFISEFLVFSAALQSYPWTVVPLLLGLLVAMAGLFRFVQPMVYGETAPHARHVHVNMTPVYIHLTLALLLGLSIPTFLADWYHEAATLISMATATGGGA